MKKSFFKVSGAAKVNNENTSNLVKFSKKKREKE